MTEYWPRLKANIRTYYSFQPNNPNKLQCGHTVAYWDPIPHDGVLLL